MGEHTARGSGGGRHELPPGRPAPEIGKLHGGGVAGVVRRGRSQLAFGVLAVLLCLLSGVAIATQVRQTNSDDSLETARPADLLVLLDSLQQREAALNTEVADLQHLPPDIRPATAAPPAVTAVPAAAAAAALADSLSDAKRAAADEAERLFLERGLQQVGGTVAELARRCDMNRSHLQTLLKKHGIRSKDFRPRASERGESEKA